MDSEMKRRWDETNKQLSNITNELKKIYKDVKTEVTIDSIQIEALTNVFTEKLKEAIKKSGNI